MGRENLEGGQCHALQPNLHLLRQVTGDQRMGDMVEGQLGNEMDGGEDVEQFVCAQCGARRTNGVQAATSLSTAAENTRNSTGRSTNHRAVPIKFAVHQTSAATWWPPET